MDRIAAYVLGLLIFLSIFFSPGAGIGLVTVFTAGTLILFYLVYHFGLVFALNILTIFLIFLAFNFALTLRRDFIYKFLVGVVVAVPIVFYLGIEPLAAALVGIFFFLILIVIVKDIRNENL